MRRCLLLLPVLALLIAIPSSSLAAEQVSFYPVAKVTAGDGEGGDSFGEAVALSGDTAVLGASGEDEVGDAAGAAYVFRWESGVWREVAKLTASDGKESDQFGLSVAISGDTVVVGAHAHVIQGGYAGAAYVFRRDEGGAEAWGEVAKLVAPDPWGDDHFGSSVAVSGDTVIVGASVADGLDFVTGAAYVFQEDAGGPGSWGQVAKLVAADGASLDEFGGAVALGDDTAVVGAGEDDDLGTSTGSAYVFRRDAGGPNAWGQVTKLTPAAIAEFAFFGRSVAIRGDTAIVGARGDGPSWPLPGARGFGSAYVFRRDEGGAEAWGEVAKLAATDGKDGAGFGRSVAVGRDTAVIGAWRDDDVDDVAGSAYVFRRDEGGAEAWGQVAKLVAADGERLDQFGISVAVSGDAVLVGANSDDDLGFGSGSVYAFRETLVDPLLRTSGSCPGEVRLAAAGLTPGSSFELYWAHAEGTDAISSGRCVHTPLALEEARALSTFTADEEGRYSMTRTLSAAACGRYLQVVDLTSCAVSNVWQLP